MTGVGVGVPAHRYDVHVSRSAVGAATVLLGLTTWFVLLRAAPESSHLLRQQLPTLARNLASALFMVSGVLWLSRWRLTGEPRSARVALAFLLLGAMPAVSLVGPLLHESAVVAQNAPSARAAVLIPVFALLLPGRRWARQTIERPVPTAFAVWTVAAVSCVLAILLTARAMLPAAGLRALSCGIAAAMAATWALLATRHLRDDDRGTRRWAATAAALLGTAELLRAWAAAGAPAAVGTAPAVDLAAVAVVTWVAGAGLRAAFRSESTRAIDLSRALARVRRDFAEAERSQRERLHDARSAVVGVLGASELLASPGPPPDVELLHDLVMTELHRLQAVLDTRAQEPITTFDLTEVLAPSIALHQLSGPTIQAHLGALRVVGRPNATATVVDNLLRNARVHAPGARVTVRAIYRGSTVAVVVEDDGPGIPEDERALVVQPWMRGSTAGGGGEGLGLHSCNVAVRAQGGTLHVGARPGGGTRVLFTVPAAQGPYGAVAS
jgi:signal transduction histidine kinase